MRGDIAVPGRSDPARGPLFTDVRDGGPAGHERNTLIVAQRATKADRVAGVIAPVSHPANCPSIMAVGAIDAAKEVANFSCGTVDPNGAIDIVGPGVNIHSSWTLPEQYNTISGTSMATPHVAGVAALIAEQHGARAWELWARLGQDGLRLPLLLSTDAGAGLSKHPDESVPSHVVRPGRDEAGTDTVEAPASRSG